MGKELPPPPNRPPPRLLLPLLPRPRMAAPRHPPSSTPAAVPRAASPPRQPQPPQPPRPTVRLLRLWPPRRTRPPLRRPSSAVPRPPCLPATVCQTTSSGNRLGPCLLPCRSRYRHPSSSSSNNNNNPSLSSPPRPPGDQSPTLPAPLQVRASAAFVGRYFPLLQRKKNPGNRKNGR